MSRRNRRRVPAGPFETRITALANDGRGVGRTPAGEAEPDSGKVVFIDGALPGETLRYLRTRNRSDFAEGRLEAVLEPSQDRVEPPCTHAGYCGGCKLQHLDSAAQLREKQAQLIDALQRIGKLTPQQILPPLQGPSLGYRRRARLSVRDVPAKGRVLVGFRERDKPYVADIETCAVLVPEIGARLPELSEALGKLSIRDQIPQIEVAVGDSGMALTIRCLQPPNEVDRSHLADLERLFDAQVFLQTGGLDSIEPLDGPARTLTYRLDDEDVEVVFEPLDFVQVNGVVNRGLVAQAIAALAPQPGDRVLELFAGLGNFTLPLARRGVHIHAVEGDAGLVARARNNAVAQGLDGAISTEVADLFGDSAEWTWPGQAYDLALLDPPRAGAAECLAAVAISGVRRIVYVSCHPATLARDARRLVQEFGFTCTAAGVIDMFPHTAHVESMAVFSRGD